MRTTRTRTNAAGLTLIELLLGLAICAMLLVALVVGVRACISGYTVNYTQARLATKSRMAMLRMLDQIRRSALHGPYTTTGSSYTSYVNNGTPMTDVGFSLIDTDSSATSTTYCQYTYWYDTSDATNGKIRVRSQPGTMAVSSDGTAIVFTPVGSYSDNVLLNNVTAFSIRLMPAKSTPNSTTFDVLQRAAIVLQIQDPDTTKTNRQTLALSGSATPRQIVWTGSKLAAPMFKYVSGYTTTAQ